VVFVANLRVVGKDESAPLPERVKSVTEAASSGTVRELLVAMRDRVAIAVEDPNTQARDLAALTRRLREISRDIESIDSKDAGDAESVDVTDEEFDAAAV
jgi:hypothetical protein